MGNQDGSISKVVFEAVMWSLFCIAILAAAVRTIIRIRSKSRLFLDDAFLFFACLALVVATVILQTELGIIYIAEELKDLYISGNLPEGLDVDALVARYHIVQYAHGTMGWLTVFAVKFSFLCFFHQLVDRIPKLKYYWRCVLGLNIVAFLYCILYVAAECPYHGSTSLQCLGRSGSARSSGLVGAGIGVDIVADLLIVSIPVVVLWQVRMQMTQKIGIGTFLCLSVCIVIASTRLSKIRVGGETSNSWQYFWLEIEACVAVCTVSITAFRSMFVNQEKISHRRDRRWYSSAVARNRERRKCEAQNQPLGYPMASFRGKGSCARMSWFVISVRRDKPLSDLEALQGDDE